MTITYELGKLGASSDKFGPCDICRKHVADVYLMNMYHTVQINDETYTIHDGGKFGHDTCLREFATRIMEL